MAAITDIFAKPHKIDSTLIGIYVGNNKQYLQPWWLSASVHAKH
jgi:hypothetical protein